MTSLIIIAAAFIGVATLVGGVAILVRGESGTVAEDRLQVLTGQGPVASKMPSEKSILAQALDDTPGVIESFLLRFANLRLLLKQADISLTPSQFVFICAGLGGAGALTCVLARVHLAAIPIVGFTLSLLPLAWMLFKRKRRLAAFAKQFPEALELIARALRAGHSLASGFHLVGQEMAQPIGAEMQRVFDQQNLGVSLDDALEDMTERVPNLDLRFFATAVVLQRQTGGDLAEILDKIGYIVRERFKIYGQVQALTGEGRLSGVVLLALPPVLFAVMYRLNPEYVMMLFTDTLGKKMLAFAVVMQVLGALVIRKIVNIKV